MPYWSLKTFLKTKTKRNNLLLNNCPQDQSARIFLEKQKYLASNEVKNLKTSFTAVAALTFGVK